MKHKRVARGKRRAALSSGVLSKENFVYECRKRFSRDEME